MNICSLRYRTNVLFSLFFGLFFIVGNTSSIAQNSPLIELPVQDSTQIIVEGNAVQGDLAFADDSIVDEETTLSAPLYERTSALDTGDARFNVDTIPSSLFTYWEQAAIIEAMASQGYARPTTYSEILNDDVTVEERVKPPPEERYLTLGGIVYNSSKNWTIWLNGKKVTPKALPKEAVDLEVRKSYIEIKWFDEYTNQILPVRLRSNQRFNIDTRIFLPG